MKWKKEDSFEHHKIDITILHRHRVSVPVGEVYLQNVSNLAVYVTEFSPLG